MADASCLQQLALACKREQSSVHQRITSPSREITLYTPLRLWKVVSQLPRGWGPGAGCRQPVHPQGVSPSRSPVTHREHEAVLGPIRTRALPAPGARGNTDPSRNQCPCRNKLARLPTWRPVLRDTTGACLLSQAVSVGCAAACPPHAGLRVALIQVPLARTVSFPGAAPEHLARWGAGRVNMLISIVTGLLLCWLRGERFILPGSFVSRESYTY